MAKINISQLQNRVISSNTKTIKVNANNKNKINSYRQTKSFEEVLDNIQKKDDIKFSKHAVERMNSRNITLNNEEIVKLNEAIKKAEEKGVNDALILMGDTAFIASIKNKTIITTVNKEMLKDNVFTNIDGAVVI